MNATPTLPLPSDQLLSNATQTLLKRRAQLQVELPKLRAREQAQALGISEAEFVSLDVGDHVTLLEGDFKALLLALQPLGKLMGLTRNESCVHERKGVYENISFYKGPMQMGVAVNPDIDLRLFMGRWCYGLAVTLERGPKMPTLYGFQFFNADGVAVHKIYTTPDSDVAAYHAVVQQFAAPSQRRIVLPAVSQRVKPAETPDEQVDVTGFRESWAGLEDTHDFYPMLRKFGVSRPQALRLAPEGMVDEVTLEALTTTLEDARDTHTSIMCFVHSPGCIQIHTGPVKRLAWHGDWFNIMDPDFNLHLNTSVIRRLFVVRKPTVDGFVTSLELYDEAGELVVYFFGARKPGKPELAAWRTNLEEVVRRHAIAAS